VWLHILSPNRCLADPAQVLAQEPPILTSQRRFQVTGSSFSSRKTANAERRDMTRQRLNTVARVGARTLVVAGFAGGVWLLSAAAAHAAAPAGATTARTDQTVVDLTTRVTDPAIRLVDQVLAPSSTVPGHRKARPAAAPVAGRSAPRVASQAASAGHPRRPAASLRNGAVAGTGADALSRLLPTVSNLLRTDLLRTDLLRTDLLRPLRGPAALVTAPVTGVLAPLTTSLRTALAPVTGQRDPVPPMVACDAAPSGAGTAGTVAGQGPVVAQHSTPVRPRVATAYRTAPAASRHAVSGTRQVPDLPERAPVPAIPDPGSTLISTTGSGSQHDAGAYAVVTAPVAASQPAGLRRLRAAEVAVRPSLADAPTFAPD
jgi:hypothetical protein